MGSSGEDLESIIDADNMRRVQFSDEVQTVEYDIAKTKKNGGAEKTNSHLPGRRQIKKREKEETAIEMLQSDQSNSTSPEQEPSTANNNRRDRRQSFAAQILMASTKWGQHKDIRQRKMSLHGKPIYFTAPSRRKHKLRRLMISVFNFLERPEARSWATLYHISTFLLVCTSLVLTVFATIDQHKDQAKKALFILEIILVVVFSVELTARIWSAGCRVRYQGIKGRLHFIRKPFCVIDIIVVVSSLVIIVVGHDESTFAATAMRGLRFLQILRMVRVDRRGGTWKLLGSVVYAHSKELITAWYIGFLALIFASFLVYQFEKDANAEEFGTFGDALWWGLITLTTIGYGDKTPHTWSGRLIASCFAILGISFFALPAGILGSGFALKVQEQHRQKHVARRRTPAAFLIQCFWRCYAADADSSSTATWQRCTRRYYISHQTQGKKSASKREKAPTTGGSRMRGRTEVDVLRNDAFENTKEDFMKSAFGKLQRLGSTQRSHILRRNTERKDHMQTELDNSDDDSSTKSSEVVMELTETKKNAIRGIRMMKFCVARRKFKEALRPYDVKDVIEQYSSGHIDMLARVKNLQSRVDSIVGIKGGSMSPSLDFVRGNSVYRTSRGTPQFGRKSTSESIGKEISMNERLMNVESSVLGIERKFDLLLSALKRNNRIPRATKLGTTLELNSADEEDNEDNDDETHQDASKSLFFNLKLHSPPLQRRSDLAQCRPRFYSTEPVEGVILDSDEARISDTNDLENLENLHQSEFVVSCPSYPSDEEDITAPTSLLLDSGEDCTNSVETQSTASPRDHNDSDVLATTTNFCPSNRIMESAIS